MGMHVSLTLGVERMPEGHGTLNIVRGDFVVSTGDVPDWQQMEAIGPVGFKYSQEEFQFAQHR